MTTKTKKKLQIIRTVVANNNIVDLNGYTIGKGATYHVIKEGPIHPIKQYRLLVIRIDNGTGHLDLMPETVIQEVVKTKV